MKDRDALQTDFEGIDIDGEQLDASLESIERFSGLKFRTVADIVTEIKDKLVALK